MATITAVVYHGETLLGEVDVVPASPKLSSASSHFPFPFPGSGGNGSAAGSGKSHEIRISHLSPPSDRCPPLAVLHTIAPFALRCKLHSRGSPALHPHLHRLYLTCFQEFKSAIVPLDSSLEIHLVAMPSKLLKSPCFWVCTAPVGLYAHALSMLNTRCLALVFDLDETLLVAHTKKSFDDRVEALSRRVESEDDPGRVAAMSAELKRYVEDRDLLRQFTDSDAVCVNGITGEVVRAQGEEVPQLPGIHDTIVRPIIRLPDRNVVLTRINPEIRDTSVFVRLRPAWEDLRNYLTARGRKRFEVYVCTMAERDYALEMWRLLDPEFRLINSKQLLDCVICVKSGSRKSLQHVFQDGVCLPKMAMVIDDRLQVWDESDQPRVYVVPAYTPYHLPQSEGASAVPVLCVARNVACNVRGGFFREFDDNLLRKIFEICYENEISELPSAPDVSDYILSEDISAVNNNKDALVVESMPPAEIDRKSNGSALQKDDREQLAPKPSHIDSEPPTPINQAAAGNKNVQPDGVSPAPSPLYITVLQEIGRRCNFKVDFRSTVSSNISTRGLYFSVEVLFSSEKIGIGIGKTREEARIQAAENALINLAGNYRSFVAPIAGSQHQDDSRAAANCGNNGFLEDMTATSPRDGNDNSKEKTSMVSP